MLRHGMEQAGMDFHGGMNGGGMRRTGAPLFGMGIRCKMHINVAIHVRLRDQTSWSALTATNAGACTIDELSFSLPQ